MTSAKRKKYSNPLLKMDPSTLYSSLYENSLACIFFADLEGNFLDANYKALDLLGYTKKDIRKLSYASLLSDNDLKRLTEIVEEIIRTGSQKNVEEFALRRKDGTFVFVNVISSLIYKKGEPVAIFGIAVDISRQKSVEAALRDSEKRHRAIMNHAPDAILVSDIEGNIVDSNPKARNLFGYSKREFLGLHFTKLHPPEDLKRVKEAFKNIVNKKKYRIGDVHMLTKDGRMIDVDINGTRIELEDRSLTIAIFREMTEYKKKQEQLKAAQKNLEAQIAERTMELMQSNTALKVLLSNIDQEKTNRDGKLMMSLQAQISPHIQALNEGNLSASQKAHAKLIEKSIQNVTSQFTTKILSDIAKLTPKEIQVASLIKEGMATKDIAKFMHLSRKTVDIFRGNIRKKMGLDSQKASLKSHLLAL
jgi:PAS domain S-box-containing protein